MAQPTVSDVHLDMALTNLSVAYIQDLRNFIATEVFPIVPVDHKTDVFWKYPKGDWLRDEARRRAPATESAGGGYTLTRDSFSCDVWAFHKDIDHQTRANADSPFNLDNDATQFVTRRLMLREEKVWVSSFFNASAGWGTNWNSSGDFVAWDDPVNSDPVGDVDAAKTIILSTTGYEPNTLVLSYPVYTKLRQHPDIIDRMKYTSQVTGRSITESILAAMFDVDRVMVSRAVENAGAEGATDDIDFVMGKHALLLYTAPSAGILQPSGGYTFLWRGVSGGMGENVGISRFYMDQIKSWRVEGEIAFDMKMIGSDLGVFLEDVVS
jgi:hypothetical protein